MRRLFWPVLRDRNAALQVARSAARWYVLAALISGAFGLISLFSGSPIARSATDSTIAFSAFSLADAALFGVIAFQIRSMSVGWSIAGLALGVVEVAASFLSPHFSPISLLVELYILLRFVNAVRAARAYHGFAARDGRA
jgi:hypothetical protein